MQGMWMPDYPQAASQRLAACSVHPAFRAETALEWGLAVVCDLVQQGLDEWLTS